MISCWREFEIHAHLLAKQPGRGFSIPVCFPIPLKGIQFYIYVNSSKQANDNNFGSKPSRGVNRTKDGGKNEILILNSNQLFQSDFFFLFGTFPVSFDVRLLLLILGMAVDFEANPPLFVSRI